MAEVNPMTGYLQDKCGACGELAGVYANGNWYCYQHSAWGRLDTAEAELAALRAENERLKARGIEGMQHRIAELEAALRAIKRFKPSEVCKDEFAYDRMVKSYRKAAVAALKEEP